MRAVVPPMAKNPIYDGTEGEIYEYIPHLSDLNTIDFPAGEMPPNLPPPRRATMDVSIPNKHASDSTETVVATVIEPAMTVLAPPPPPGAVSSTEDGEAYIPMASSSGAITSSPTSPSPRYTEPPTLAGSQQTLENRKLSYDLQFRHHSGYDDYDRLATMNTM